MRVHVFQHVPFEGPGSVAQWAHARGAALTVTPLLEPHSLPELGAVDVLVVLGGPMSVHDEACLPWLRDEKHFIGDAIASGTPVLGICLGAQLIAAALGARVYAGAKREIGWFPVYGLDHAEQAFRFPDVVNAFHWHGETFDLPTGATLLARSEACACQAFQHYSSGDSRREPVRRNPWNKCDLIQVILSQTGISEHLTCYACQYSCSHCSRGSLSARGRVC